MVIVHGLRILTDLAFYYALASFPAVCYGGRYALAALVLQTVLFTVSAMLRKNRVLRMAVLAPMLLFWLLPEVGLADSLMFIPAAAYLIWQAYTDTYPLEWGRQVELFSAFWKFYAVAVFFLMMSGMLSALSVASIPIALIMLAASVLLMRTLRHEPETYCQRRYQLVNAASVAVVVVIAAVMSTDAFLGACVAVFRWCYNTLVLPVLLAMLVAVVYLLRFVAWLVSLLNIQLPQSGEDVKLQLDSVAKDLGLEEMLDREPVGEWVLILLCALVVILILFFFFRWMAKLGWRTKPAAEAREERFILSEDGGTTQQKFRPGSAVQRIRAQYRKFLKLYVSSGGELETAHTSLDVDTGAKRCRFDTEASEELREIYIRARYADQAERQDVSRVKELYAALKKNRR